MRLWHAAAFLLIACGGKIATESTGVGQGPGAGDDDDDTPTAPGSASSTASSGYPGHPSSGMLPPPKPYPYPYPTSTSSTSGGTSSSSGTLCGDINVGCGGTEQSFKCAISGPPGTPGLQCYGVVGQPKVECNCYGTYLDAGTSTFEVKVPKEPSAKDLYAIWQKYCGGSCN